MMAGLVPGQEFGNSMIQGLLDMKGREWEAKRAATQLTLGGLIEVLEKLPEQRIVGFGAAHSYRGYYSDLAFKPTEDETSAITLLTVCREDCMGQKFDGYKGGDFYMTANTPVWISDYGCSSGLRLMGLEPFETGAIIWRLEKEKDD